MNQITSPLQPGMQGSPIADVQDALLLLISHQLIRTFEPPNRPTADELQTLVQKLNQERAQSTYGSVTQQIVRYFQNQNGLGDSFAGAVEAKTARVLNRVLAGLGATEITLNTVSGTIYDVTNALMPNVIVQAYDKDLRTEQLLGKAVTDVNGFYRIAYDAVQYASSEVKTADLFIRVLTAAGVPQGESPVNFNVHAEFVLDFKVDNSPIRPLNEFDALVQKIKPLTDPQNVPIADLLETDKVKDFSFLAGETGEDFAKIALLPIAFSLSGKTRIAPDIFYGLFRLQFPTDLNALLLIKSESIADGIRKAIVENIISAKWEEQVDSIMQKLNQQATGAILSGSDDNSAAFRQIIGAALPNADHQQAFVNVYLANESTPDKFWDALAQQPGFEDPKTVAGVQSVLQLNLLTNYQPALTTLLYKEQQQNPALKDMRGFATFGLEDWHARITKLVVSGELQAFPDGIEGNTPEEKAVNYADSMTQLVKNLYPTDVFAGLLSKDAGTAFEESKTDLAIFFANNVDYDLKNNSINKVFDAANLNGVTDKTLLKKELININRLSKLTNDYSHVSALRLDGIDSATTLISRYTPAMFTEKFSTAMPPATAAAIYKKAERIDNRATVIAMGIKMRNDIPIYAINGPSNDAPPDYVSLFGDTNCDCEHCQSVYGPSAYFVDCLQTLDKYNSEALTELTGRRPDLTQILLTCKNTNTPLPYIDLVNELLENTIAPIAPVIVNGKPTYPQFQTTITAEELLAYPEHVNTAAYVPLKTATSSFNLPLNLPLEETRLYLDKLGVKRYALMELYFGKQPHSKYADLPIATEYLQLSQTELNIINGTTPMPVNLGKVTDFLKDTDLTYIEMLQVLGCFFVNPMAGVDRSIKVVSTTDDQTTCHVGDLTLQSSSPTSLKIMPFIRLWKKTGWGIFDLDRALTGLGVADFTGDLNNRLIIPLSHIARLKAMFNLSVQNIMSLWTSIDTHVYVDHAAEGQPRLPTQFESLFQNKRVTSPVDPAFSEPGGLSGTLAAKGEIILAALNLSQKDFEMLNQGRFVDGNLNITNLSVLFRHAMLARVLKMSVDDLIGALDLTDLNPFGDSSRSADTLLFIDKISFIRSSGFSMPELKSLLEKSTSSSQSSGINNIKIANVLAAIRDELKKIELLEAVGSTPQEQAINKLKNQNNFVTETIGAAFNTEAKVIDILVNDLVKSVADNSKPAITPFIDEAFIAGDGPLYSIDPSTNVITWTYPDLFNTYVVLGDTWSRISRLTSKLKISNDEFIYFQRNEGALNIGGIWNLPATASGKVLFPGFENLVSLVNLRKSFALPAQDWFKLFDFAILNSADAKRNLVNSLSNLCNLTTASIEALLGEANDVNDPGMLKYAFPADYLVGSLLSDAIDCAKKANQLGSGSENIARLIIPVPSGAQENDAAKLAKSLLKSKYDVPTWLSIIQPLSNQLRLRKRDALTSYILTSPETGMAKFRQDNFITDFNSLYAFFLIDLEMDACMLTSRIKQAISSTQLFVDRCLLNLETGIVLSTDFTTQWNTWRERYRAWEANRKIFLYPENWIEPELRDDKSPFFKELESKLKQNEITDETAEDALRFYLEKLDTVANLEMVGVYPDNLTAIVHVIGRTRHIPHQYFYTKQIQAVWSAWEKIDLDIEGDHILPVVWNNRLMLFWGTFTEKQEKTGGSSNISPNQNGSSSVNTTPAKTYLEMKLAWSEYKNGKWGGKKISKDVIKCPNHALDMTEVTGLDNKVYFSLNSAFDYEKLVIHVFNLHTEYSAHGQTQVLESFIFNNCNSLPFTSTAYQNIAVKILPPIPYNQIYVNYKLNPFSLYASGTYKDDNAKSSDEEIAIFQANPSSFHLLPNHHEIEKIKPSIFFYSNERNNFYVHSQGGFTRPPFDDVSVLTDGVLISRKAIVPFSVSNISLAGTSTMAIENPSRANFAVGSRVVSGVDFADFSTFPTIFIGKHYAFQTYYHPYVCELIKTLNTSGIDGLYKNIILDTDGTFKDGIQNKGATDIFIPNGAYNPTSVVQKPYPVEQMDFNYSGIYSIYNWELFFHIPLSIAARLSQNQKFDEARKWFHYIFDPTRSLPSDNAGIERFWIPKPFKEEIRRGIQNIEDLLNNGGPELDLQLATWEANPFNPHAVARLRVSAYMRTTVTKYINNLIAWGDQLFRQDTLETINEATLYYIMAANLLGKKPEKVPSRAIPAENSFATIQDNLDSFNNAKVAIQSYFSLSDFSNDTSIDSVMMPLFCIPKNDVLLGYWDTVADRLFKIRHCLNIEGVFQQLPLFEPPIDPALLVRATAAGLDLNSILNDMNASLPNYRFQVLLQKANELCNDVKVLGSELLAALEKRDAEQLSLLRSSQELNMLEAVRDIKVSQIDEANEYLNSIMASQAVIVERRDYYSTRPYKNPSEDLYFSSTNRASELQQIIAINDLLASFIYLIPTFKIGGPFTIGTEGGGLTFGNAALTAIKASESAANLLRLYGEMANVKGGYDRRQDDWNFQAKSAELELKQMDKQIVAAQIRLAIAEKELENHDLQLEQSKEVDDFLNSKYTNVELYDYMVGQISSVYFQSYQLAYNTAKKAEKCLQFELGIENTSFVSFGYWDSLKKGLLSGEKLQYDLRRLENAYLEQNQRRFELTKSISLLLLDPLALVELRETGMCSISLPEVIYDLDYPGHYFRRIMSVSLTLPCVVGPYTTISCTLRLRKNSIRANTKDASTAANYPRHDNDKRFIENNIPVNAIATSHAQNDSGVFELSFRDERYLPFEGAGAVSEWTLELFNDQSLPDFGKSLRQFDYSTISDAILHIKYTAREGGDDFKKGAVDHLRDFFSREGTTPSLRLFNLRQEFPSQWHRFLNPANPANGNVFEFEMTSDLFPVRDAGKTLKVNTLWLLARCTNSGSYTTVLTIPSGSVAMTTSPLPKYGSLQYSQNDVSVSEVQVTSPDQPVKWSLKVTPPDNGNLQKDEVGDVLLILGYEWE